MQTQWMYAGMCVRVERPEVVVGKLSERLIGLRWRSGGEDIHHVTDAREVLCRLFTDRVKFHRQLFHLPLGGAVQCPDPSKHCLELRAMHHQCRGQDALGQQEEDAIGMLQRH